MIRWGFTCLRGLFLSQRELWSRPVFRWIRRRYHCASDCPNLVSVEGLPKSWISVCFLVSNCARSANLLLEESDLDPARFLQLIGRNPCIVREVQLQPKIYGRLTWLVLHIVCVLAWSVDALSCSCVVLPPSCQAGLLYMFFLHRHNTINGSFLSCLGPLYLGSVQLPPPPFPPFT